MKHFRMMLIILSLFVNESSACFNKNSRNKNVIRNYNTIITFATTKRMTFKSSSPMLEFKLESIKHTREVLYIDIWIAIGLPLTPE